MERLGNCNRCGLEFRCDSKRRVCPACLIPKQKKPINPQLTFREKQVVALVAKGKLNKDIAYDLHLAEGTIKEYLNRIFRKLGAHNRTEVAIWEVTRER